MNKMREYERGREDGLTLALRIVKQGGNRSPGKAAAEKSGNKRVVAVCMSMLWI